MPTNNLIIHMINSALYRLGESPITSVDEGTATADACKELYPDCRDTLLSWQAWPFATVRQALARLNVTPPSGHAYYYALPTEPALLRGLSINECPYLYGSLYQREIAVRFHTDGQHDEYPAIATDAESVTLRYVGRTLEASWSPLFCATLSVYLAQALAPSISGKASIKQALLMELYGTGREPGLLTKLRDISGHEDSPRQIPTPTSYLDVRGMGSSVAPTRYGEI